MNAFRINRRGFTLIELLVTMGLIIALLGIAIAVSNSATLDSYKIVGAGDRLSQTLITSKSRAARDKAPRGVRLIVDPASGFCRELIYIEQPEPWVPDQSHSLLQTNSGTATPTNTLNTPIRSYMALRYPQNLVGGNSFPKPDPTNCLLFLVLTPLDEARFAAMFVSGKIHVASSPDIASAFAFTATQTVPITALDNVPTTPAVPAAYTVRRLVVSSIINPDFAAGQTPTGTASRGTFQTPLFGIYLPAKPLAGEPSLILSKNAAVDMAASLPYQQAPNLTAVPPTTYTDVDILFSPTGQVMYRNDAVIGFLIRDTSKLVPTPSGSPAQLTWLNDGTVGQANFRRSGEMTIVAVYPKTGTVFTKPVAEPRVLMPGDPPNDPFEFCRDAIANTGL